MLQARARLRAWQVSHVFARPAGAPTLEEQLMQIAGNICRACGNGIVLSREGKFCPHCRAFVHLACEPLARCGVCGQPFEKFDPPSADPLVDALIPSALRPPRSGGSVFAVSMVLIVLFVLVLFLMITHGHAF
jgi:hypothetical protein